MRFVLDGPDIPNSLIKKWRDGDVLFLAGAGVSVPSGLPLFDGLALDVYKELNESLFTVLATAKKRRSAGSRNKLLDTLGLSADRRVEANLFFDKQYDRFFSVIEKRFDPDIQGKTKTRRVRNAVEKILGEKKHSESHSDLLRLSLAPNSSGDQSRPLSCRLVTTNFDLLFEKAWSSEFGGEPISFDARMAPRSGAHDFQGIIHLHGALSATDNLTANYVLSSRDFARVYLRSGVIGNYIYDLIRRYTLVLVGYSADDPPMRYLMDAIGEDTSLFSDMKIPYAITDIPPNGSEAIEQAAWKSKEISAIFFQRRKGKRPFAPLWESIHAWADWARDGTIWIERQLAEHTGDKYKDASPFQKAFVQDLMSILDKDELNDATEFLIKQNVDFGWVSALISAIDASDSDVQVGRR
jgi:NAD-dependent SIR2 family protein deacetylase